MKSFKQVAEEIISLQEKKNKDYKDTAKEMYDEYGITYYTIMLEQKLKRIKSISQKENIHFEGLEDNLKDLAAYAIMAARDTHNNNVAENEKDYDIMMYEQEQQCEKTHGDYFVPIKDITNTMEETEIGYPFIYNGTKLVAMENTKHDCSDCYFVDKQIDNYGCKHCFKPSRKDNRDVKFVKKAFDLHVNTKKLGVIVTESPDKNRCCSGCKFLQTGLCVITPAERHVLGQCSEYTRTDKKNVIFKEI